MTSSLPRRPDFLIAGAPRSGTTWLYCLLERHPEVYLARPANPEPKFFLINELYARGLDYYCATWFADVPAGCVAGEKSANYLESAAAAERIGRDLEQVRLVFILRHPVERAYSNYLWSCKNGLETADFRTALERELEREPSVAAHLRYARPHSYFSRGLYAELLLPYYQNIGRERILCLRFEDICERPGDLASRLHRFLGVAERSQDAVGLGVINESLPEATPMPLDVRATLTARYREPNQRLSRLLGQDFWPE